MKTIHSALLLALLLVVTSCSSIQYITHTQLMNIRKGMTQDEVTALMKRGPDYRRFENQVEEWEFKGYGSSNPLETGRVGLVIWFVDGKVDGMDSFAIPTPQPTPVVVNPVVEPPLAPAYPTPIIVQRPHHRMDAMPREEFARFMKELRSGFSSERMKKINEASRSHGFTSAQCKDLVALFSFTDEKIEFLTSIYPSVTDKNRYADAVNTLSFSFDREKVWNAIKDNFN